MKNKILKIFSSNIKIRISGKNINNFIKRLIKNKINIIELIPINHKEINLIIKYNDLEKIKQYTSIYNIKIIRYYGKLHIMKFIKKNIYILFFLLIGGILIYILSNIIFSIEVIHSNSKITNLVIRELEEYGIKKYSFVKNYETLEKIEKEILNNNKDSLEWMEIIRNGTKYIVRVEERIINNTNEDLKYYDIVASKNAVIKEIEAAKGEKIKNIDTYAKKGETIISGYITGTNNEKILNGAKGTVLGEVWYTIDINYPYYYNEIIYTGNKKKVLVFNFLNKRVSLFDFNKYKTFDKNTKVVFKNNIIPISLNYEYQYETNVVNDIHTYGIAKELAIKTAKEKLLLKYQNIKEIKDIKVINEIDNTNYISLTLFVTVYEDVTEYKEIDISNGTIG